MKPGSVSSAERVPPPTVSSASRTATERPFRASSTAAARPFGPEPTTTASYITLPLRRSCPRFYLLHFRKTCVILPLAAWFSNDRASYHPAFDKAATRCYG